MAAILLSPFEKTVFDLLSMHLSKTLPEVACLFQSTSVTDKEYTPFYSFLFLEPLSLEPAQHYHGGVLAELRLFRSSGAPIQCLLHVRHNCFQMIEIFCADSSALPQHITPSKVELLLDIP